MIKVVLQPKPADFDAQVRKPGRRFLSLCPAPTQKQWNNHSYWRRILRSLHSAYGGICSYSCHWIPFDTGADTVEHFKPKSRYPEEAYEWRNYRLVCQLLNSRKGSDESVLDPFKVKADWFVIDFPSLLVKPASHLRSQLRERITNTCNVLGLNDEDTCMMTRTQYVIDFCCGEISFAHVQKRAPFLASQMEKNGLDQLDTIRKVMSIAPS